MIKGIYIELDTILDTRLATIFKHYGEEKMKEVLKSDAYYSRIEESYPGIDKKEFDMFYSQRDKSTLFNSLKTKVIDIVHSMLYEDISSSAGDPIQKKPKIILNVYPYKLEQQEEELLTKMIVYLTDKNFDVETINYSYQDLTPSYILKNIDHMFLYNYGPFVEAQNEALKQTKIPSVNVYAAAIYFDRKPNEEELEGIKEFNMHPFKLQELVSSMFFNLKFLEPQTYCAVIKNK